MNWIKKLRAMLNTYYREINNRASLPVVSGVELKGTKRSPRKNQYHKYKERARVLVHNKLSYWNTFYGFTYDRVSIRDQKTRWGSCSSKGNLNFSYKILFLDDELQDYLIVHELCHLKELNHSKRFWEEVAKTIPEYKKHRKRLRVHSVPD